MSQIWRELHRVDKKKKPRWRDASLRWKKELEKVARASPNEHVAESTEV
ncbi:MAG: hypothetical protein PHW47_11905 [Lachnospira sp.]|nr:hypothetical protein [Lachnospira sp.]